MEGSQLIEVLESTKRLLHSKCTLSVPNDKRRRIRALYPQPWVPATNTPKLDENLKQILPTAARMMDKELAKIQNFILDTVSHLVSLLETETAGKADTAALELMCNANARISCLRREKVCAQLRKVMQPLAHRDELFVDTPLNLFGAEFAQKSR